MKKLITVKLEGPVTVAFTKIKNLHVCNALEFDIVGTGDTADEALAQLKELVEDYMAAIVAASANGKRVNFFNPAEQETWNTSKTKQHFRVEFIVRLVKDEIAPVISDIADLGEYRDSIEAINLVPA